MIISLMCTFLCVQNLDNGSYSKLSQHKMAIVQTDNWIIDIRMHLTNTESFILQEIHRRMITSLSSNYKPLSECNQVISFFKTVKNHFLRFLFLRGKSIYKAILKVKD